MYAFSTFACCTVIVLQLRLIQACARSLHSSGVYPRDEEEFLYVIAEKCLGGQVVQLERNDLFDELFYDVGPLTTEERNDLSPFLDREGTILVEPRNELAS